MKNTLLIIFLSIILGFSVQAQVLNVPTIEQEQTNWCWNGVAKSALDYYGFNNEQCVIADWVRTQQSGFGSEPCCENPSGACNSSNVLYNANGSIQDILFHYGEITSEMKGFAKTEADVASAIARNAVIPCAWLWSAGGGHAVLIHGYVSGNVYYMDPWFGEGKKIATYSNFNSGNDGSQAGHHSWTQGLFFTSDVTQVDTVIPCEAPLSVNALVTGTTISLSWPVIASAQSYLVRYRVQGSSTWLNTTATSNAKAIAGLAPETTYEFQVASVCNSVSESDYSASVTATTEEGPLVYCTSKGTSVAGEWIKTVSIGSINNTSNANGGYADFTAQSTNITAGTSANITLTPGFPDNWLFGVTTQPETWAVWIDLNQDGDFTDANEQRFVSASTSTTAVTASISIPSGTPAGVTRMRVAMKRTTAATSCETFANGEVEDYSINIIADVPPTCDVVSNLATSSITHNSFSAAWTGDVDATSYTVAFSADGGSSWTTSSTTATSYNFTGLAAETQYLVKIATVCSFGSSAYSSTASATTTAQPVCATPAGLALGNASNTTLAASWNAAANAVSYVLEIKPSAGGSWTSVSKTSTSHTFAGLTPATSYDVRITSVCSFGNSAVSTIVSATTTAAPPSYCAASGTSANEWIQAVSIGSINNTSNANGGYANYTNLSTNIAVGASANLTITPGFPYSWLFGYTTQAEFYTVWIDLNRDGDFEDANELRYVSPTSTNTYQAFTVSISIPAGTAEGSTRMRVAMKRRSAAASCGSYSFGEVEDYTINIGGLGGSALAGSTESTLIAELSSNVYPNPASETATIELKLPVDAGTVTMKLIDLTGKMVANKTWTATSVDQQIIETVDVSALPKGVYFIQIASNNGAAKTHKLVVQ